MGSWIYFENCVLDIQQAEDGGEKAREFTQGDDLHE